MKLEELAEKIDRLRGVVHAQETVINALLRAVPADLVEQLEAGYLGEVAVARQQLQDWKVATATLDGFEKEAAHGTSKMDRLLHGPRAAGESTP